MMLRGHIKRCFQFCWVSSLALGLLASSLFALTGAKTGPAPTDLPTDIFDARQAGIIMARITGYNGKVPEALALFNQLLDTYPDDQEIGVMFCSFLLDRRIYDMAQDQLTKLLQKNPGHPHAQRLQARLYVELEQYARASALYEHIIQSTPNDAVAWNDYAGARLNNTQWPEALANYSRVLELQPENREAREIVNDILRTHGPRLDMGYNLYDQMAEGTTTQTFSLNWGSYVTESTKMFVGLRRMEFDRNDALDEEINDGMVILTRRFNQIWSATAGAGGYNGASDNISFLVGADFRPFTGFAVNLEYQKNRPWVDPVDAVLHDGSYDSLKMTLDWNSGKRLGIYLEAEDKRYKLGRTGTYGYEPTLQGLVSWMLFPDPEIFLGYSYYRSWFDYGTDEFRPIAMVDDQGWHGVFAGFLHRPWDDWTWGASAGWRYDHIRDLDGWFLQPHLKIFLANRMELDSLYEYSSESTDAVGGETQRVQTMLRVYF